MTSRASEPERKDERIDLRATEGQVAAIDEAARATGQSRSDFMLEASMREVDRILADRRVFELSRARWEAFLSSLDGPPPPEAAEGLARMRRLLRTPGLLDDR